MTVVFLPWMGLAGCVPTQPQDTAAVAVPSPDVADTPPVVTPRDPVVAPNFRSGSLNWQRRGGMIYRYAAIERDGIVWLWGSFTGRGNSVTRRVNREVLDDPTVMSNDQTLFKGVRYFAEASHANWDSDLVGTDTNCRSTGKSVDVVPLDTVRVNRRGGRYWFRK